MQTGSGGIHLGNVCQENVVTLVAVGGLVEDRLSEFGDRLD